MTSASKPIVAIVGQPNVGKSTLFNRLTDTRPSIVSDVAGTTRDRVIADVEWGERLLTLVDTGGLDEFPATELWSSVRDQIQVAIEGSDVVVMLADVTAGVTAPDEDVARVLRLSGSHVVLAVNKADNELREADAAEFYRLGLGEPTPISAYHNRGVDDLMARVLDLLPVGESTPGPEADFRLAIVGRTNVGKSMLLNSILGRGAGHRERRARHDPGRPGHPRHRGRADRPPDRHGRVAEKGQDRTRHRAVQRHQDDQGYRPRGDRGAGHGRG